MTDLSYLLDSPRRSGPAPAYPCLTPGTARYGGCVGAAHCRETLGTPDCLFGAWPDRPATPTAKPRRQTHADRRNARPPRGNVPPV